MPVLSEPYAPVVMMSTPMYLLLAFALSALCSLFWRRRSSMSTMSTPVMPAQTRELLDEKRAVEAGILDTMQEQKVPAPPNRTSNSSVQRPFTPPLPTPLIATQDLNFGRGENASYYSPLSESPVMSSFETFDSFEALGRDVPRRRSYTKTTPGGVEVTGEVVLGEGWRRHTRVFGGGVCMACEESDRRMTA